MRYEAWLYIGFGLAFTCGGIFVVGSELLSSIKCCDSTFLLMNLLLGIPFLLIFLCIGLSALYAGGRQLQLQSKFGKAEISIADAVIRPGEEFHFSYQQQCRKAVAVKSIGIFLVFRESVRYDAGPDASGHKSMDRLVQQFMHEGRVYEVDEMIRVNHLLRIPTRKMGIRNPFMHFKDAEVRTTWVVKVHIDLRKHDLWEEDKDFWEEHKVEVSNEAIENGSNPMEQSPVQSFDVFLSSSQWRNSRTQVMDMLAQLLPHLSTHQAIELFWSNPCLIMENVAEKQAQNAKEYLEAAGAKVKITPAKAV